MQKIQCSCSFLGTVIVVVPDQLSEADAKLLAGKVALARIVATADNPDAPEEAAYDNYLEECSPKARHASQDNWDAAEVVSIGGRGCYGKGPNKCHMSSLLRPHTVTVFK